MTDEPATRRLEERAGPGVGVKRVKRTANRDAATGDGVRQTLRFEEVAGDARRAKNI